MVAFATEFGLPVAIKAAFGGGGRGLKVARQLQEIPELFESATREAVAAFGRGECFVERYLDRPRHVETQCLADSHGNVVVVSTRDCSLQRRHQKLVEEAPAPFLSRDQVDRLYASSKAILTEAGYVGAGTCEFLVGQDGTISFLEVNTRLQVEHPVSEEVTGLDLVREMFRIADGEALGYDDPAVTGHSIEFRINAEDAGRDFMPAPGTLTTWRAAGRTGSPGGRGLPRRDDRARGLRLAGGQDHRHRSRPRAGARPVATGAERACRRRHADRRPVPSRRPRRPGVHRRGRAFSASIPAGSRPSSSASDRAVCRQDGHGGGAGPEDERWSWRSTASGSRLCCRPAGRDQRVRCRTCRAKKPARRGAGAGSAKAPSGNALASPMQGTIVKVAVADGDQVEAGDLVVVLEAMKMEQPLNAHRGGQDHEPERRGGRDGDQRVDALRDRRRLIAGRERGLR